jgi:protein-tyrosine phosphatase
MPTATKASSAAACLCAVLPLGFGHAQTVSTGPANTGPLLLANNDDQDREARARRVIPLEGQSNFRDLGGYESADGRHVKWGEIFRSGELSHLTGEDYGRISALGIRTVYDLRDQSEQTSQRTAWAAGPIHAFASTKQETDSSFAKALAAPDLDADKAHALLASFYSQMPRTYAPEYRAIFHELLEGHTPLLLHCTAGKDRTGLGSALILAALGVPRATIIRDYSLTDQLLKPARLPPTPFMQRMMSLPPNVLQAMTRADPAYIEAAFNSIQKDYGSTDKYLDAELDVGPAARDRLKALLLE